MNPSVKHVEAIDCHKLKLQFENGEQKIFDVTPYLDKGIFVELKDENYFKQVRVAFGSIEWPREQDFSRDTLYLLGTPLNT